MAELARQYESGGGLSFRGFVDDLRVAAENAQAAEAPILEEGSDGVRMMTVHKAKGLEFPVVILADLHVQASRRNDAGRWLDPSAALCALKIGGWAPHRPLLHDAEEAARDQAEGVAARLRRRDPCARPARRAGSSATDRMRVAGSIPSATPSTYRTLAPAAGTRSRLPGLLSRRTRSSSDPMSNT